MWSWLFLCWVQNSAEVRLCSSVSSGTTVLFFNRFFAYSCILADRVGVRFLTASFNTLNSVVMSAVVYISVLVKVALEQDMKAQNGSTG